MRTTLGYQGKHRRTTSSTCSTVSRTVAALAVATPLIGFNVLTGGTAFADGPAQPVVQGVQVPDVASAQRSDTSTATINHGADTSANSQEHVTICHATGSSTNPYVVISPSKTGVLEGHVNHQDSGDIIPSFPYQLNGATTTFPGQNTTASASTFDPTKECAAPGAGPGTSTEKVTFCHATASTTNPFVVLTLPVAGVLNGHVAGTDPGNHQNGEDVIPPFDYTDVNGMTHHFDGQNYTPGEVISETGCAAPPVPVTVCRPTTVDGVTTYRVVSNTTRQPGDVDLAAGSCPPAGGTQSTVDVCPNLPGDQDVVPSDRVLVNGNCLPRFQDNGNQGGVIPGGSPLDNGSSGNGSTTVSTPGGSTISGGTGNQPVTMGPVVSTGSPVTRPTVTPEVATTASATGSTQAGASQALPFTGSNTVLLVEIGLLMIIVGGGITLVTSRPRPLRPVL